MKTGSETSDSEFVEHLPCEACGSSDANSLYSDGHTYCHVCKAYVPAEGAEGARPDPSSSPRLPKEPAAGIPRGEPQALSARGIHQETCAKWRYHVGFDRGRPVQIANYVDLDTGAIVAAKLRFPGKEFTFAGNGKQAPLYGQWLWSSGGKRLVITEGEIDALSVSQAQENKWPVVSLKNGAAGATKDIQKAYDWVSSFETVVIWFDNDEPGKKAAIEVAEMLPPGKARIVKSDLKDANEYLKARRVKDIVDLTWRAEAYRPDGIVDGSAITLESLRQGAARGYAIPYPKLDEMLGGLRKRELTLLTAGSGIGKSTLAREIAYHLHQQHGLTIGNVYLEESKEKTAQGYVAIHNDVPLGELRQDADRIDQGAWERSLREVVQQRMFFYDHFGSLESAHLLNKLRYLAVGCGCDFIVLDHISIVVSGQEGSGEGERRDIDRLMTQLRQLVENTGVGIIAIVHLKQPEGKPHEEGGRVTLSHLRGSGSLKQLSDNVVAMERDQQAEDDSALESLVRLLKNREFGIVGLADTVKYHQNTGRLKPVDRMADAMDDDVPF